ncbi:hypothetical protein NQ314_010187 [Rhamnusium bicolor]|uniref:Uncharacterized protein n=1 Tax=Rhamnusium bicolor TaxID=1586634 RepID=A0AAV8XTH3_9CUCU|nr:hypothetical protein NQ314_010187 [Rhamnusium bicolor]
MYCDNFGISDKEKNAKKTVDKKGLLWSLASVYYIKGNETTRYHTLTQTNYYSKNYATELLTLGAVSICLTFVNIVCIYVAGILVFKIKEVAPIASRDHARRRFWKHDIKIARDYNKTLQTEEADCMITKISEEIAQYQNSKLNSEQFFHSTNFERNDFKVDIKRSEYTWSPCMNLSKKSKEVNELYENLIKCKPNVSRILNFNLSKPRSQHRRLSQIFDQDNLTTLQETNNEKGPSIAELSCESNKSKSTGKLFSSGNKKFIVTPCEADPLKV